VIDRYRQGLEISLAGLTDLSEDEMSHMAGIVYQQDVVNEDACRDCIRTIRTEQQSTQVSSEDDLLAFRNKLKERKGLR
jgi:hypothetical protein